MQIRLSVRETGGYCRDIAITAPAGTPLRQVADGIGAVLPDPPDGDLAVWSGSRRLPPAALLGGPGLRTGDLIDVDGPGSRDLSEAAVLRLHVIGGPDAGLIAPLPRGVVTIGRAPDCDISLTDPDVSRQHAAVTITTAGISVRDLGSTNGTLLDDVAIEPDGCALRPDEALRIGESVVCVAAVDEPAAAIRPGRDGVRLVNRPPRLPTSTTEREVVFPARAGIGPQQRVQWFAAVLPAIAGGALALVMHHAEFLMFALLSPIMMLGTAAGDRLHWRRERRREATGLRRRDAEARHALQQLLVAETAHRRRAHPDAAAVLRTATIPDCRLWERRRADGDLLDIRLGLANAPATGRVRRGSDLEGAGTVRLVPATVSLKRGPLGVAGPRGVVLGVARWAIAQLAVLHSPADVDLVLVLTGSAAPAWTWARWLPHLHGRVACTADERAGLVSELSRMIDERLGNSLPEPGGWPGRWTVLVIDRAGEVADTPGLGRLLTTGSSVGITAICMDDEERRLPTACAAVARVCGETGTRLDIHYSQANPIVEVISDRVSTRWAGRVARALAPLVDASADASDAIPDTCRLLDILGLGDLAPESIISRWRNCGQAAAIGVGAEGAVAIDLVRDGPHALIAGTTGSGKSELLQSLVATLAASHPPEALAFVLIDYKGGAAFADCARLPHTVGLVTDLDGHLTERALQSLDAELRRRESLFASTNAKDLEAYRRSPLHLIEPLGRLVLVVDEFAALAEELPTFVNGLVGIAQRGRSLGVHLVLATQRPGGVISPEIRANTALRIALRVTDPAESADVIGTDAAAVIDKRHPGRAFVRAGTSLTEIQTARVGGVAPVRDGQITVVGLDEWGRPPAGEEVTGSGKTDLYLLVDAVREAAARSATRTPSRPWLPPLGDQLPISDIQTPPTPSTIALGLADMPATQRQIPLLLDLQAAGPVMFIGALRSGRTTALRMLAASSASRLTAAQLHIYVIDCAGGGLRQLAALPHCGSVTTRDDFDGVERLLTRLTAEVARRHAALAELGASSVAEACDIGVAMPFVLLIIDGWEGFVAAADEHDAGRSMDVLLGLLRECASVGFTVAITGDRNALAARVASTVARKFVLRLADRGDYALAGIPMSAVPESMPPGRALNAEDATEVQFGFLGTTADSGEQWRVVADVARRAALPDPAHGPIRVRALPTRIARSQLGSVSPQWAVLGVGGDSADTVAVDLFAGEARLLVAGPPRSGRSTALCLILEQSIGARTRITVAAPRRSSLAAMATELGVDVIWPDDRAVRVGPPDGQRVLLLVDDSEAFLDTPAGDALSELVETALPTQLAAVVAGRSDELAVTYRGVASEVRRSRTGLLLQPGPGDGELLGIRLQQRRGQAPIPGRGVLVLDQPQVYALAGGSNVLPVQVALPTPCGGSDDR